ncbi:hypothetical protein FWF74_01575 [Candidatus Saccharibacteria bacterium]|nr:hypothetical protein [Candidatus Saccharibacteria bacterium]MCL1963100.1 hypothetical protein [Candidatus Saccharibacteria bacterium]
MTTKVKPIIAVDIDDVLSRTANTATQFLREKKNIVMDCEHTTESWISMFGPDQSLTVFTEFCEAGYPSMFEVVPGSYEALQKLKPNFELVILTSRQTFLRDVTLNWLEKYFADTFDKIYFAGIYDSDEELHIKHKMTKTDRLREISASYLIDDQPKHVNSAAETGVECLLFGDYGWNRNADIHKNVTRAKDWEAVAEYFSL